MGISTSIVLFALGAILRFAVYDHVVAGINVGTIGVILMVVGAVGLILALILSDRWGRPHDRDPL